MDERRAQDVLPTLIAIAITFIVLDTFFLVLRFISRVLIQKVSIGVDDFLIIPAYCMNVGLCCVAIVMAKVEMIGNPPAREVLQDPAHMNDVIIPGTQCIYALLPLLYLGAMFPKLSLLSLYLRIFVNRSVRIWTYVAMAFVIICGLAFTLRGFFACQPVEHFWNRLIPGHCIDLDKFYRINTPINILVDLVILVIPMPALWKLQAPRSKKIGLTFVFSMGGLGMLACMARFIVLMKYTASVLVPLYTTIIVGWCIIEPAAYLIAACLPPCSSIIMLIAGNKRVREIFSLRLSTSANTASRLRTRGSGFRLSSKPSTGFAQLIGSRGRSNSMQTSPTKSSAHAIEEKAPEQDVPVRDMPGIGIRTDIYISSERSRGQQALSLPDVLRSPGGK